MDLVDVASAAGIVVALGGSALLLRRLAPVERGVVARLRARLLLGLPVGTLLVVGFVLAVYLFVQDGLADTADPLVIPFRAWSYVYPLGVLTSAFAHDGPGHLTGNLLGTLVYGSLAEYAWGHVPPGRRKRSAATDGGPSPTRHPRATTLSARLRSWRTDPYVRALVVFPGVTIGIGIVTVVFSLGPVIGFSGVVFAFLGFALVTAPLGAIVALLAANGLGLVYRALREPIVVATASPSPPSPPWWSQIAIQGHALGLLLGVVVGLFVVRNREWTPSATRIWVAVVFAAVAQNLWAVYWFGGGETFVLYRSLGLVLVVVLGALVTAAATASDREIAADISRRDVAVAILLVGLTLLAGPAVPSKAVTVGDDPVPNDRGLTVRDYTVTYDEDVPNRLLSVAERFGIETDDIRTSGVIVTSQRRAIWRSQVSQDRLAFSGTASIGLGGLGWRETVVAQRRGWSAAGNGTAYAVSLRRAGDEFRRVFASDPVRAEPRIDDRTVSVRPPTPNGSMGFRLAVERSNETLGVVAIPGASETATAGGLRLEGRRRGDGIAVYASRNGTVVRVVSEETYR